MGNFYGDNEENMKEKLDKQDKFILNYERNLDSKKYWIQKI